jgi:uracil-DNA glycosylase
MITNAVRCARRQQAGDVEEAACRPFLASRLAALPRLKVIVTLGDVSRRNVLRALGLKASPGSPATGRVPGRALHRAEQLPLLRAQHEHRPADGADVRGGVPPRAALIG